MMKQRYNWDCGHMCLIHQGMEAPDTASRISVGDMAQLMESSWSLSAGFGARGVYLFDGSFTHWVSYSDGVVFDPSDGMYHDPIEISARFAQLGAFITMYIPTGEH